MNTEQGIFEFHDALVDITTYPFKDAQHGGVGIDMSYRMADGRVLKESKEISWRQTHTQAMRSQIQHFSSGLMLAGLRAQFEQVIPEGGHKRIAWAANCAPIAEKQTTSEK